MADRTVNVRLNLDPSGYTRGATQAEQDNRRVGASAASAAASSAESFNAAAASTAEAAARGGLAQSRASERAAQSARAAAASIAESAAAAAAAQRASAVEAAEASAAANAGAFSRMRSAVSGWTTSVRTASQQAFATLAEGADRGEKGLKTIRTGGLALVGVFLAASAAAAKFEKSMSAVQAVAIDAHEAISKQRAEMEALRSTALQAGRDTAYSASQAADAEAELARAGVSVADITGGALTGALSLAAAGQLDLGEAATISAQAMNTFKLNGADVAHIADVLAAGANKSASDVHGLGESLRAGGLVAQQTGFSLEDTVATLSAFADNALIGSDAGTSLKTMLQRLTPQSAEAAAMMDRLGFSAYDSQGNFIGLAGLAGALQQSFGGLAPEARNAAMGVVFGSDAVRAATVLMSQGSAGIREYISAVNDQGAAVNVSAVQLDNLSGDLEKLKGSIEVALIESGGAGNKVLREMVQAITDLVNAYASLPGWAQEITVGLFGLAGALAVAGTGFLLIMPKIAAFQESLSALALTMPALTRAASTTTSLLTSKWAAGIGLAITAVTLFGLAHSKAKKPVEDFTDAVKADSGALADNVKSLVAQKLQQAGALDTAKKYGVSLALVTDAALGNKDAVEQVNKTLQDHATISRFVVDADHEMGKKTVGLADDALKLQGTIQGTNGDLNKAVQAYKNQAEATGDSTKATGKLGDAAAKTADDLKDEKSQADQLKDALAALNGVNIDSAQAAIGFQSSIADVTKAVKDNGHSLDITTEKGRAVKGAILDAADAAMKHAEAVGKQKDSVDAGNIVLGQDIDQLRATMKAAGFTTDTINSLLEAYGKIPTSVTTVVKDPYALDTIADLQRIKKSVEDVPNGKSITVRAPTVAAEQDLAAIGFKVEHLPNGEVKVTVPTSDAFHSTNEIQGLIDSITGKDVHVRVFDDYYVSDTGKQLPMHQAYGGVVGMATGGVRAAASGLDTGRQAMMASRPILWAEAGREAYIPMDPAKRARSTQLLGTVASEFGFQLVPQRDLIPARQLIAPAPAAAPSYDQSRTQTVILNGAKQSSAEQRADLMRHLTSVG